MSANDKTAEVEVTAKSEHMTLDEFVRANDEEGSFELINGERIPVMPTALEPNLFMNLMLFILQTYCKQHKLGKVSAEQTFVLLYDESNWVTGSRIPDILFVSALRWKEYMRNAPDLRSRPLVMTPDLVVEIMSPTDRYKDVENKAELYLQDGVKIIWVVDVVKRRVRVFKGNIITKLGDGDTLTGEDIIPGFTLDLTQFFDTPLDE